MNLTTYGYQNPSVGDLSKGNTGWMAQLNFDITRLDGHSHNGVDSVILPSTSIARGTFQTKGANYALLQTDSGVCCTATMTVTLPDATIYPSFQFNIVNVAYPNATVTLATLSGQTIATIASGGYTLTKQFDFVSVQSDGFNWQIVGAG